MPSSFVGWIGSGNGGMYAMMSFHAFHLPNRVMRFLGYPMRAPLVLLASLLLDMATGHLDIIGHCAGAIYGAVYYLAYRSVSGAVEGGAERGREGVSGMYRASPPSVRCDVF